MSDYKSEFNVENYLSNLSYINKDFNSLWNEILETVPKLTDKWVPSEANESDPLLVLLKELAIFADKNNYNVDKNILERFPATLTQLRSAYNVYDDLGYTPDWYMSATTPITINFDNRTDNGIIFGSEKFPAALLPVTLPLRFKMVSDDKSNIVYTLFQDFIVETTNATTRQIFAMEGKINDLTINGKTQLTSLNLDSQNRLYFTQTNIAQNGILISNYSDFSDIAYDEKQNLLISQWQRVDNINQWPSGSYVYKLGINSVTGSVYIQFPEDIGRLIGDGIYVKYLLSSGEQGNMGKGTISKFLNTFNSLGDYTISNESFTLFNSQIVQNGRDPLDIEDMRKQFNKVIGVFNTLVTLRDYENYLYEYQNNLGEYIVSNVHVSDRFHDLTDSIAYKHLNSLGEIEDVTETLKKDNKDLMTPYNLKFYPLYPYDYSGDKEAFNQCFEIADRSPLLDNCENAVEEAKCISHDILGFSGTPIFIPYDLEGQIFLQNQVSSIEAADILRKVNTQLYAKLNPRELEWGKMLNYSTVVETIKSADSRIQYVALNAIKYDNPISPTITPSVEIRNVETGNKAFTQYKDFAYYYNQTNFKYYPSSDAEIAKIETRIDLSKQSKDNYTVGPNETFNILVPNYVTKTTYSNYLYVKATGSTTVAFVANAVLPLPESTTLEFYETKDSEKPIATITRPTKLRCNKTVTIGPQLFNMGSSYVIEVLQEDTGKIRSTEAINTDNDTNQIVYVCTNSKDLSEALKTRDPNPTVPSSMTYTLLPGEYLFYTDEYGLELGVFGEGTTLKAKSVLSTGIVVVSNIQESTQDYKSWTVISSGNIEYTVNNIYSFGEKYFLEKTELLKNYPEDGNAAYFSIPKGTLKYDYDVKSISEKSPEIVLPEGVQGLLRLALATSPTQSQLLTESQKIHLYKSEKDSKGKITYPPLTDSSNNAVIITDTTVQSNKYLAFAGGSLLLDVVAGEQDLQFITYTVDKSSREAPIDDSLVNVDSWTTTEIKTPGESPSASTSGEYVIFPVTLASSDSTVTIDDSQVHYIISKAGQDVKAMKFDAKLSPVTSDTNKKVGIGAIGLPRVVGSDGKYIKNDSGLANVSDLVGSTNNYTLINANDIGYSDQYDFTYIPEESDIIEDPTAADSYFLTQHVCNKYVLPKLNSTDKLTISSMSIKRS